MPPKTDPVITQRLLNIGRKLARPAWPGIVAEYFPDWPDIKWHDAAALLLTWIRNRQRKLRLLLANRAQRRYGMKRTQRNIILKARQLGMTTYISARYFLATITRPGTVTLQVAHSLESAQQIFRIVQRFSHSLHRDVRARAIVTERCNVRELAFAPIDSRYIVDTAGNRNAGRGLTIHNLHASEVALWGERAADTMAALLAAVVPGGDVDLESTPHGTGGYFHQEWLRANEQRAAAPGGFTPHFFPWWYEPAYRLSLADGELLEPSEEEHALMKREGLAPEQIKYRRQLRANFGALAPQEFVETPAECFLVSGRPVFDVAAVEARLREVGPPAIARQNDAEWTWFEPMPGRSYIIGADVAEGLPGGDYSAAVVIDARSGLQCAELLTRWPVERFARELARLGERYNAALLAVERNNHGHAVLHALRHQISYPRVYRHADDGGKPGWPMNVKTKPEAVNVLQEMLRVAPRIFSSPRLLEQCRAFRYADGNEMCAPDSGHDDLVIAMAIALAVRAQAGATQVFSVAR